MSTVMEKAKQSLTQKRNQLQEWVKQAPDDEKQIALGPATPEAVQSHIHTISNSIDKIKAGTLGTCEICHESVEIDRLEVDYTCCVCLDHYSEAEVRSLERELELAQAVQRSLLPQEIPEIPGLQISAFSRPAQILGGDYFDFSSFADGRACLAIADVAGHGVSASLHMASIQAMLRSIVPSSGGPAEAVAEIHKLFVHNIQFTTFVTLFMAAYDSKSRTLSYCNAGQNPPIVLHADDSPNPTSTMLAPTGPAIGLIEDAEYQAAAIQFQPNDLLLMYTDGLIEAANPAMEMYGMERLMSLVEGHYPMSPDTAIREIRRSLDEFVQGSSMADDTTILACAAT